LITLLLSRMVMGGQKIRWKKLVGEDKGSLIKAKAQAACGSKGKRKIYSLLPISR